MAKSFPRPGNHLRALGGGGGGCAHPLLENWGGEWGTEQIFLRPSPPSSPGPRAPTPRQGMGTPKRPGSQRGHKAGEVVLAPRQGVDAHKLFSLPGGSCLHPPEASLQLWSLVRARTEPGPGPPRPQSGSREGSRPREAPQGLGRCSAARGCWGVGGGHGALILLAGTGRGHLSLVCHLECAVQAPIAGGALGCSGTRLQPPRGAH